MRNSSRGRKKIEREETIETSMLPSSRDPSQLLTQTRTINTEHNSPVLTPVKNNVSFLSPPFPIPPIPPPSTPSHSPEITFQSGCSSHHNPLIRFLAQWISSGLTCALRRGWMSAFQVPAKRVRPLPEPRSDPRPDLIG